MPVSNTPPGPAQDDDLVFADETPAIAPKDGGAWRVLIVDDDADSAELLVQLLEMRGHEVRSVHSASQAVTEAAEFLPDVAILDVGLPDMSGYELAQLLRKSDALRECKLIAVTGYSGDSVVARCKMAGFDQHLVKPVDLEALARSVLGDIADGNPSPRREAN